MNPSRHNLKAIADYDGREHFKNLEGLIHSQYFNNNIKFSKNQGKNKKK